jgi:hypothetical protein
LEGEPGGGKEPAELERTDEPGGRPGLALGAELALGPGLALEPGLVDTPRVEAGFSLQN